MSAYQIAVKADSCRGSGGKSKLSASFSLRALAHCLLYEVLGRDNRCSKTLPDYCYFMLTYTCSIYSGTRQAYRLPQRRRLRRARPRTVCAFLALGGSAQLSGTGRRLGMLLMASFRLYPYFSISTSRVHLLYIKLYVYLLVKWIR